jgi:methionine-rich copper-binding protein CopC
VLITTLTGDAQTEPLNLFAGNYTVTARVAANTNANTYSTTWQCLVNDAAGPAGSGITFTIAVKSDEKVVCTFTHTPPTATGAIVIAQESVPSGGTGFAFIDNIAAPNSFTLNDGGSQNFANLAPGAYGVTAGTIAGWQLTGIRCVDPDNGSTATGATATIDLDAGETVLCTFTSSQSIPQVGTIVINNESTPPGAGFAFTQTITAPTSFLLDSGGSKSFTNVPADSYEVAAVPPAEWRVASVTCIDPDNGSTTSGATAVIDLDAGETVSCTFAHRQATAQNRTQLFLPFVAR